MSGHRPLLKFTPGPYQKFYREKTRGLFAPRGFCTELVRKRPDVGKNAFDDAVDSSGIGMQSVAKFKSRLARHSFEKKRIEWRIIFFGEARVDRVEARFVILAEA